MIRARITTPDFIDDHFQDITRAEISVDGRLVTIHGESNYIVIDIPVINPDTGDRLFFYDDPKLWLRYLPTAFRSGDVNVEILEDS